MPRQVVLCSTLLYHEALAAELLGSRFRGQACGGRQKSIGQLDSSASAPLSSAKSRVLLFRLGSRDASCLIDVPHLRGRKLGEKPGNTNRSRCNEH